MNVKTNTVAESLIRDGILKLERTDFLERLYSKDVTIWKTEEEHTNIIKNSLGWLTVYDWTLEHLSEIKDFAAEAQKEFTHCVVLGMGGSSLAPEVFRVLFGKQKNCPELVVLDSTNADWVGSVRKKIKVETSLFIFASKSGGTVEPASHFAYFYDEVGQVTKEPGKHFIAITDPGTGLEKLAKDKKFRKIFLNRADIGGRFSALSLFGMVPAAIMGVDVEKVLLSAKKAAESFVPGAEVKTNAALLLGSYMGAAAKKMEDKLTVLMPKEIEPFGLWIEQLVAESTGKEGKGIVPVVGEKLFDNVDYRDDRIFVHISYEGKDNDRIEEVVEGLLASRHPIMEVKMESLYDLGAQFLMWEIATAAAGALMELNPFDQPNVQEAKTIAKGILESLSAGKEDADTKKSFIISKALQGKMELNDIEQDLYSVLESNDYIALLPYIFNSEEAQGIFEKLRTNLFNKTKRAVLFGYGPRYLHSTGQLHKGDGNNGVFIIFSADADEDIKIPGQKYSFGDLANAQALGDFKALDSKGRRAIKVHLTKPVIESLKRIIDLF
ncbi:Phosphoglucose isomerase (PGI) [Elusimicrobium minutum Pei191]|uniref:Glucose-6-phosphate isomerase n=1 Tax=Elusimicrobium minutum (strain Pei191) TaxID=445932 RepID=B2KDS2_ELUMP|nr:phosphoglucose isomerase (PGI) [Elusimicrobium minutum]ACC98668.1 Phosphoglucose isomerase (PGI) [Elusimicrobium minutum Pei191]